MSTHLHLDDVPIRVRSARIPFSVTLIPIAYEYDAVVAARPSAVKTFYCDGFEVGVSRGAAGGGGALYGVIVKSTPKNTRRNRYRYEVRRRRTFLRIIIIIVIIIVLLRSFSTPPYPLPHHATQRFDPLRRLRITRIFVLFSPRRNTYVVLLCSFAFQTN